MAIGEVVELAAEDSLPDATGSRDAIARVTYLDGRGWVVGLFYTVPEVDLLCRSLANMVDVSHGSVHDVVLDTLAVLADAVPDYVPYYVRTMPEVKQRIELLTTEPVIDTENPAVRRFLDLLPRTP